MDTTILTLNRKLSTYQLRLSDDPDKERKYESAKIEELKMQNEKYADQFSTHEDQFAKLEYEIAKHEDEIAKHQH